MSDSPRHRLQDPSAAPHPGGWVATARAALDGGAQSGFLVGLADGIAVLALEGGVRGPLAILGCLAASSLLYGLVWMALLLLASPLLHLWLRGRSPGRRIFGAFALGLGLGVFVELYWWTRPYVFPGIPAFSPQRVAATLALLAVGLGLGALVARVWLRVPQLARRLLPLTATVVWLGGALFLLAPRGDGSSRGRLDELNRDVPNVLLVVVDALRQDVIGAYGNERVRTPAIDGLAERGVLFENAFVQAPYTWSSFGSLLTGKYPRRHGLVMQEAGRRMRPNVTLPWHLKQARLRAGGAMTDAHWASGTFMTGTLSNDSGLMRGFDTYYEALVGHERVDLDDAWSRFRSDLVLFRLKNKLAQKLVADPVVETAIDWMEQLAGRRFVAMVHLYSTHTPYDPPAEFREMYCDPDYDGPVGAFYADARYAIEAGDYVATPADEEQIRNLYYAGTTQADAAIGKLLDVLRAEGALEDTLVIVTSDHGEELGDHRVGSGDAERGLWEHNWMYQTNLRVPLVMSWPGGMPQGERIHALVESVDLLPTICDLFGLELPDPLAEDAEELVYDRVDGRSLLPLIRGETRAVKEFSFSENGQYMSVQDGLHKLIVPRDGLKEAEWAEALRGERPMPRFFDLAEDPHETNNLFRERAGDPEMARLLEALRAWDEAMPIAKMDESPRDRETIQNLQDLGYAHGVGIDPEEDAKRSAAPEDDEP